MCRSLIRRADQRGDDWTQLIRKVNGLSHCFWWDTFLERPLVMSGFFSGGWKTAVVAMTTVPAPIQTKEWFRRSWALVWTFVSHHGTMPCFYWWPGWTSNDGTRRFPAAFYLASFPDWNRQNVAMYQSKSWVDVLSPGNFICFISKGCVGVFFSPNNGKWFRAVLLSVYVFPVNHLALQPPNDNHKEDQESKVSSWHQ